MIIGTLSWADLMFMLQGALVSMMIALLAMLAGTAGGIGLGWLRSVAPALVGELISAILDVFRSVPLLIQLIAANTLSALLGLHLPAFWVSAAVLGLYATSFCTEIVHAGISAVPSVTRRAGRSLGLSYSQDLRYIVLPIALRVALPNWINLALGVLKDTSLILWIGVVELLRASQIVTARVQEPLLVLSIVGLIYFLMSFPLARLSDRLERKWHK